MTHRNRVTFQIIKQEFGHFMWRGNFLDYRSLMAP